MKALHECPPLLVDDQVFVATKDAVLPARISMVTQKSDGSWVFRASYKTDTGTHQISFCQEQINEGNVFLLEQYAQKSLEENDREKRLGGDDLSA